MGLLIRPWVSSDDCRLSVQLTESSVLGPNCSFCTRFSTASASVAHTEEIAAACAHTQIAATNQTGPW